MSDAGLVQRTVWVLRAVAARSDGIGLSDVARAAGVPKATCYRVLQVLERERWVILDPDTRRYRVSLDLLSLVGGLVDQADGYKQTQAMLGELSQEAQEAAGFDVLLPPKVMVLAQVPGPFLIGQTLKPVPRTQPVWHTSSGKALLSVIDPDVVRREYGDAYDEPARKRHGSLNDFIAMLQGVREEGYASAYNELEPGAASVAAPVPVRHAYPYALWVGGPTYRIPLERIADLGAMVRNAADRLGQILSLSDVAVPQI